MDKTNTVKDVLNTPFNSEDIRQELNAILGDEAVNRAIKNFDPNLASGREEQKQLLIEEALAEAEHMSTIEGNGLNLDQYRRLKSLGYNAKDAFDKYSNWMWQPSIAYRSSPETLAEVRKDAGPKYNAVMKDVLGSTDWDTYDVDIKKLLDIGAIDQPLYESLIRTT